jgi:hypothetical protein
MARGLSASCCTNAHTRQAPIYLVLRARAWSRHLSTDITPCARRLSTSCSAPVHGVGAYLHHAVCQASISVTTCARARCMHPSMDTTPCARARTRHLSIDTTPCARALTRHLSMDITPCARARTRHLSMDTTPCARARTRHRQPGGGQLHQRRQLRAKARARASLQGDAPSQRSVLGRQLHRARDLGAQGRGHLRGILVPRNRQPARRASPESQPQTRNPARPEPPEYP